MAKKSPRKTDEDMTGERDIVKLRKATKRISREEMNRNEMKKSRTKVLCLCVAQM